MKTSPSPKWKYFNNIGLYPLENETQWKILDRKFSAFEFIWLTVFRVKFLKCENLCNIFWFKNTTAIISDKAWILQHFFGYKLAGI